MDDVSQKGKNEKKCSPFGQLTNCQYHILSGERKVGRKKKKKGTKWDIFYCGNLFIEVYFVEVGIVYKYKLQTPEHQHEYP